MPNAPPRTRRVTVSTFTGFFILAAYVAHQAAAIGNWRNSLVLSRGGLLLFLESSADPEYVAIGMAEVHLADEPRHIGRRKCDLQPGGYAVFVHLVHIVHPDRHPDALVGFFVSILLKRGGVRTAT